MSGDGPQLPSPGMDITADATLLRRFATGRDDDAFAQILHRHADLVHGVCRRVAGSALAEDAFQSTFIALSRRASALTDHPSIAGWLHHAALRISRGMRRQAMRRQAREARAAASAPTLVGGEPGAGQDDELDAAIGALPDRYRVPVVLHYLEGLSLAEMSRRLGITEAALAQQLSRARRKLQRSLSRPAEAALGAVAGTAACPADARARARDLARSPHAQPAHLARAATLAGAVGGIAPAVLLVALALALALVATLVNRAAKPGPSPGANGPRQPALAQPALAGGQPSPSPPAWVMDNAWDITSRNCLPIDSLWEAEGIRPVAASEGPAIADTWARIGSRRHPAGSPQPARLRAAGLGGWDVGVPRVGPDDELWSLADGDALGGARPHDDLLVLLAAEGAGDAVLTPLHAMGMDGKWTIAVDRYEDLPGERSVAKRRHALLVDLGSQAAGQARLRLITRVFTSEAGPNDYAWTQTRFAEAAVDIGPASAPVRVRWSEASVCQGVPLGRSGRCRRMQRGRPVRWSPGDGGTDDATANWSGILRERDALLLLSADRLPPRMPARAESGGEPLDLVLVGPCMPEGEHLALYDCADITTTPRVSAQFWWGSRQDAPPLRRIIVMAIPGGDAASPPPASGRLLWYLTLPRSAAGQSLASCYIGPALQGWQPTPVTAQFRQEQERCLNSAAPAAPKHDF